MVKISFRDCSIIQQLCISFSTYTGSNISKNCATEYTLANLYDDAQQILKGSLEEIVNDPFNKIQGSQPGPELISSAESLLQNRAIYDVAKFCKILDKLWKAVTFGDKSKVPTDQREKMWKACSMHRSKIY